MSTFRVPDALLPKRLFCPRRDRANRMREIFHERLIGLRTGLRDEMQAIDRIAIDLYGTLTIVAWRPIDRVLQSLCFPQ